jgi:hypothetical protein
MPVKDKRIFLWFAFPFAIFFPSGIP